MERSRAAFRFRRDRLNLSQNDMAEALGVARQTVEYWEQPGGWGIPEDAWAYLDAMDAAFAKGVAVEASQVANIAEEMGGAPRSVALTYYRSQQQYDEQGRDGGPFGFRNAMTREVARILEESGLTIEIEYAD